MIPSNEAVIRDIETAKNAKWGHRFKTKEYPEYPCPDCGRMLKPVEAWVNQKGK